mgnify:CR=1 FL=1
MRNRSILALLWSVFVLSAQEKKPELKFADAWVKNFQWRPIGPASMGGRIVDLEVVENDPINFYIATASGSRLFVSRSRRVTPFARAAASIEAMPGLAMGVGGRPEMT